MKQNLTEPTSACYKSLSVGLERGIFFDVEQHCRNRQRQFKQIKGGRQIHSVTATDVLTGLKIMTRSVTATLMANSIVKMEILLWILVQ